MQPFDIFLSIGVAPGRALYSFILMPIIRHFLNRVI